MPPLYFLILYFHEHQEFHVIIQTPYRVQCNFVEKDMHKSMVYDFLRAVPWGITMMYNTGENGAKFQSMFNFSRSRSLILVALVWWGNVIKFTLNEWKLARLQTTINNYIHIYTLYSLQYSHRLMGSLWLPGATSHANQGSTIPTRWWKYPILSLNMFQNYLDSNYIQSLHHDVCILHLLPADYKGLS